MLCSQRGEYINGECQCNPGWKGKECSLRHDECEVPDCNGHGHCVNGKCTCVLGYKGKFCEQGKINICIINRIIYVLICICTNFLVNILSVAFSIINRVVEMMLYKYYLFLDDTVQNSN